jgi:hypothetical protein
MEYFAYSVGSSPYKQLEQFTKYWEILLCQVLANSFL